MKKETVQILIIDFDTTKFRGFTSKMQGVPATRNSSKLEQFSTISKRGYKMGFSNTGESINARGPGIGWVDYVKTYGSNKN